MKYRVNLVALIILLWPATAALASSPGADLGAACVQCHSKVTPKIVTDWKASKHSEAGISCDACHGGDHRTATDVAKAKIPTPDTCGQLPCNASRAIQERQALHGVGGHGGHADNSLATDGPYRGYEGMRGLPQAGDKINRADRRASEGRFAIWDCLLRRLPYAPHLFCSGGPITPSVRNLPHGFRPSAMGDVFVFQARRTQRTEAT